jgi:hypothetical protein
VPVGLPSTLFSPVDAAISVNGSIQWVQGKAAESQLFVRGRDIRISPPVNAARKLSVWVLVYANRSCNDMRPTNIEGLASAVISPLWTINIDEF